MQEKVKFVSMAIFHEFNSALYSFVYFIYQEMGAKRAVSAYFLGHIDLGDDIYWIYFITNGYIRLCFRQFSYERTGYT